MLRMAEQHGTTAIVATPHANQDYKFDPQLISQRIQEVSAAYGGAVTIHRGCDFHLTYDNIQDAIENPGKYTIDGGPYLLVEFSDLLIFKNTQEIFERLQSAGMTPIVTHPERNSLLRQRLDQIKMWVANGATTQVTGQSLTGRFGQRALEFSRMLLENDLVHFIASDGHDCEHRPPVMNEARAWLRDQYGEQLAETLCVTNPGRTLTGESLVMPQKAVSSRARKWYQLWR